MSWFSLIALWLGFSPDDWTDEAIQGTWAVDLEVLSHEERAPAWQTLWRGDSTQVPEQPAWIVHTVTPRESVTEIAVRYGVSENGIRTWNRRLEAVPRAGDRLRIHARRIPPARERRIHFVNEGETWGAIAAEYRVSSLDLHGWNSGVRALEPAREIVVWFDPGAAWTTGRVKAEIAEPPRVPATGFSVGRPARGRVQGSVQVPESSLYSLMNPDIAWGSSYAVQSLVDAFANFRRETGFAGEFYVASMSRKGGGRFKPHRSHQSGRDIDIRLPLLPGALPTRQPEADEVDWMATWGLVHALLQTGAVDVVFLEAAEQRRLYEAARALGVSHDELAPIVQWPYEGLGRALVRHERGHDHHIHVRFKCAPYETRCKRH